MIIGYFVICLVFVLFILGALFLAPDDDPAGPVFCVPDPEKTITLAAVASWYQLAHEAQSTDHLLERASSILG